MRKPQRWILHVDLDAFFASVEQRRNPKLLGKPVAVGSGVVASCSYEARKQGVRAGMPLQQARKICPGLIILPGRAWVYRAFAQEAFCICSRYTPQLETYLDEADCDMTGTEVLHGSILRAARRLAGRIKELLGLPVTVGLGTNRMIAKLAAKTAKPNGIGLVPPGAEAAFLTDLPVEMLPGIGPQAAGRLAALNVRSVGQLRAFPPEALEALFGSMGRAVYERCRGRETPPVKAAEIPGVISRRTSFDPPETDLLTLDGLLQYLTERLGEVLRERDLHARRITVKVEYPDGMRGCAGRALLRPTSLDGELFEAARLSLKRAWKRRVGIQRLIVSVRSIVPAGRYLQLTFEDTERAQGPGPCALIRRTTLMAAKDAIRRRWGYGAVLTGRTLLLRDRLKEDTHGFLLRTSCLTL